ncbi:MAG: hypothetical protein PVJ57_13040 [Phycisphaerae bacterium]
MRLPVVVLATLFAVSMWGCASGDRRATAEGLPGVSAYYEQAVTPHHRAVRKPVRDRQQHALRMLAEKSDTLLRESAAWDSEARLVSLSEAQRPAACAEAADFRAALERLRDAATRADVAAVRAEYARALSSYRQLAATLDIGP